MAKEIEGGASVVWTSVQLTYFATLCRKLDSELRDYIGVGTLLVQGANDRL